MGQNLQRFAFSLIITSFLAIPNFGNAYLGVLQPEANNLCPHYSPPILTVTMAPELNCGDVAGIASMFQKINRWMPKGVFTPRIGLAVTETGNNAYFNGFALHVPIRIANTRKMHNADLFTNNYSRAVIAHEYGHAMLTYYLAAKNPQRRNDFQTFRKIGELDTAAAFVKNKLLKELKEIQKRYQNQYGNTGWTQAIEEQMTNEMSAVAAKYKRDLDNITEQLYNVYAGTDARLIKNHAKLSPYHEFFSDLIAVLDARDWKVTGQLMKLIDPNPLSAMARDFTNANNSIDYSKNFEAHGLLGPARYALYKYLQNNRCLNVNPQPLVSAVLKAIMDQDASPFGMRPEEYNSFEERLAANRRFIGSIEFRLKQEYGLCR